MIEKLRIAAIGTALILGVAASANAQCGSGYAGFWGGYGCLPCYDYGCENVPYFALHPPVYYSEVVPRTYGYSPFAYPPGTMTPDVISSEPAMVRNPYVPSSTEPKPSPARVTLKPLRIANPYVLVRQTK